jgi:hypothetical protein
MAGMRHTRHEKEAGMRPTGFDGSPELRVFFENYAKAPNDDSPPPMAPIILTNEKQAVLTGDLDRCFFL